MRSRLQPIGLGVQPHRTKSWSDEMDNDLRCELEREISDWSSLTARQGMFDSTGAEWVFRGQSGNAWPLCTTLERTAEEFGLSRHNLQRLEIALIHEFIRGYHLYSNDPPPKPGDTIEWLALMRHHGTPTRLLDFTFSFLVASYFAIEDRPQGTPIVWAVNKTWLTHKAWEWAQNPTVNLAATLTRFATLRDGAAFRELFFTRAPNLVCPVSPFRRNQRLTVQQGIFILPGNIQETFTNNLEATSGHAENVLKVPLNAATRTTLLMALDRAGLNRASLFPGLDGFSQSLRTRVLLLDRLLKLELTGARSNVNIGFEILEQW
jgi:hypothetical protein